MKSGNQILQSYSVWIVSKYFLGTQIHFSWAFGIYPFFWKYFLMIARFLLSNRASSLLVMQPFSRYEQSVEYSTSPEMNVTCLSVHCRLPIMAHFFWYSRDVLDRMLVLWNLWYILLTTEWPLRACQCRREFSLSNTP